MMKILVRLPNWLGDAVMAVGALHQLPHFFPDAEVSVIVKRGLEDLLLFFPPTKHQFVFSKEEFKGLKGVWQFGKKIKAQEKFDLFFCFPDSFSSALMGYAAGARQRIGYKKEGRNFLLTEAYHKYKGLHRVQEYLSLVENFTGKKAIHPSVQLQHSVPKANHIVININSEASSRRLIPGKAAEIIAAVRESFTNNIIVIGGPKEQSFVEAVMNLLPEQRGIQSLAGKTSLAELCEVLAAAQIVLSTDSGPAHLANALGTHTVVLFGAGNENNTAPFNKDFVQTLRLGKLSCEPCTKNICMQFETPQCLELLETETIIAIMKERISYGRNISD